MLILVFTLAFCGLATAQYLPHEVQETKQVVKEHYVTVPTGHLSLYKKPIKKYWSPEQYELIKYKGPLPVSPGFDKNGSPLPILDTPEAIAEKAKHFSLLARSLTPSQYNSKINHQAVFSKNKREADLGFGHGFAGFNHFNQPALFSLHNNANNKYHGPIALPPGYDKHGAPLPVLDTPEVAAEKAKHLALVVAAKKRAFFDEHNSGGFDGESSSSIGGNDFLYGHHTGLSSFHDDGFSSGVGLQSHGFRPSLGLYGGSSGGGGELDFKYNGPLTFSHGFDKHGGSSLPIIDTSELASEKSNHFAAYAKIASDRQLDRSQRFHDNF